MAQLAKKSRLYSFADAAKVCPEGFRLPTKEDFEDLNEYAFGQVKDEDLIFFALVSKGVATWAYEEEIEASGLLGFNALLSVRCIKD